MYLILGFGIVLVIIIGYAMYYYDISGMWNNMKEMYLKHKVEQEFAYKQDTPSLTSGIHSEPQVEKPITKSETWCFVGEDLTGRFCVKVPSPKSCTQDRTFGSRSDCEMTPASHMPAGIITSTGLLQLNAK